MMHTHNRLMGANDAEERGQLIPELPDELALAHVIPRLPWFTRPLCRALSKSWRAILDTRNPQLDLRTRAIHLPLLRGLFLFCTFDKQIFIRDPDIQEPCRSNAPYLIKPHWRKLPPLPGLVVPPPTFATMVASSGMVYVWSDNGEGLNFVLKLDIGRADWIWNKFPVPSAFSFDAISFNDKIYVPRVSTRSSTGSPSERKVVLVHDMKTDKCKQVKTWNQDDLRALSKSSHSHAHVEEMYSFVEQEADSKLEVLMYDAGSDVWRTREEVPIPEVQWSELPQVKLLNSDCFEPAPEMGINVVWIDQQSELISWFNSSVGITWVDINYNPLWEGKHLEYIQFMRGSMYGVFYEDEEEQEDTEKEEDGGGLSGLTRCGIMKGRIIVASSSVAWEEVHEVGFFQERYKIDSSVIQPIDFFTLMA